MKFLNSALAPLQGAQQERSTFISSLVPILSEYGMQPSAHDAQSIVSNLKVGFLMLIESKKLSILICVINDDGKYLYFS